MGLLLLFTSTLLSSYFHPGTVVGAQALFTIKGITLSIEPSADVTRDTNVTLRCHAVVSSSGQEVLSREYTIYKDNTVMYTKPSSTSEYLLYPLPEARVSNSGKYKCKINIEGKQMTSNTEKLTVSGLSKPVLQLNTSVISEGDELKARCSAPGETGSFYFYFYEDSKEIQEVQVQSNQAEVKFRSSSVGIHRIHCAYTVLVKPDSFKSEESNAVQVSVRELPITVVLEITPQHNIYEGDQLVISCTINNFLRSSEKVLLYLSQGNRLLRSGETKVNHSMVVRAQEPREFECKLEMGNVVKTVTKTISVTELFSVPTLTISPAEVFQRDYMTITCRSESYASEKLNKNELTYSLEAAQNLIPTGNGVFYGRTLLNDFNYTCIATAKDIVKHSNTLLVHPKVHVSPPKISVLGRVVLGQPFKILCKSDYGDLPINYTLVKEYSVLSSAIVKQQHQEALFTVTISKTDEINKYMCEAKNGPREGQLGKRLNTTVTVPLSDPTLTVLPTVSDVSEGNDLYLICGVKGSPPVTFKWYREGSEQPLFTTMSEKNHSDYRITSVSKEHSGKYFCKAVNPANNVVSSNTVNIEVRLALWKKAVIGGFCLVVVAVLVVVFVLCFRSKRGKMNKAAVSVWSNRPPEDDAANDEESSVESNEPDVEYTEVVHPHPVDPARVPLRRGTDTVYSELQNSPHGAADHHDYGSVEYAALNGEQSEINHYHPEVNSYPDLPEPVD